MEFLWTNEAHTSFNEIKKSIRKRFTEKEVEVFILELIRTMKAVETFPKSFPVSKVKKFKSTRKALIHPHSTMYYRIKNKSQIIIITFWDNRDNPEKLKK